MGQSSSGLQGADPPKPKKNPPVPIVPKSPSYVVPENKVLPNGLGDINNAKKLLRPVSQELTKFHPDFAEIFSTESKPSNGHLSNNNINKENNFSNLMNGSTHNGEIKSATDPPLNYAFQNGVNLVEMFESKNIRDQTDVPQISNMKRQKEKSQSSTPAANLRRTQSMERERPSPIKAYRHRRQSSVSTGAPPVHTSVIYEDPREHLYNVARHEPFSNYQPSTTSLPLKSTFDLDYSFNVTYAQLSEYRRQKRINEMEEKTGIKMEELEKELAANNTVPKSPFDRNNLGDKQSTPTVSTSSSDTGVSKSKKKKAPPPPPGVSPIRSKSPGRYSLHTEPPADYDMEEAENIPNTNLTNNLQRSKAPNPLQKRSSAPVILQKTGNKPTVLGSNLMPIHTPSPAPPPPPPPPPLPPQQQQQPFVSKIKSNEPSSTNTTQTQEREISAPIPGKTDLQKSVTEAKAQIEALRVLQEKLNTKNNVAVCENETLDDNMNIESKSQEKIDNPDKKDCPQDNEQSIEDNISNRKRVIDSNSSAITDTQPKEIKEVPHMKRMSSLLQHDIVLAAQARGSKIVKTKAPPVRQKPKDASELFREEIAKAANARELRRQNSSNKEDDQVNINDISLEKVPKNGEIIFESRLVKVKRQNSVSKISSDIKTNNERSLKETEKPTIEVENNNCLRRSEFKIEVENEINGHKTNAEHENKAKEVDSERVSNDIRVFDSSWTPAHDLESDDDIVTEEHNIKLHHSAPAERFKSFAIPSKVAEIKSKSKEKTAKNIYTKRQSLDSALDENNKFESLRKLKKSVKDSMKNAFGSISKASGKMLKRQKSQEYLDVTEYLPDTLTTEDIVRVSKDKNWQLSGTRNGSLRRASSESQVRAASSYFDCKDEETEASSESDSDFGDIDFSFGIDSIPNKKSSKEKQKSDTQMKRTGVAYMSNKGQIVVLPEYQTVSVDNTENVPTKTSTQNRAPKLFGKKRKKFAFESTVRQTEKERMREEVARQIREKEHHIEEERKRQQEMEHDFRRLRELETEERLQRLQTNTLRQQINFFQKKQVRDAHSQLNGTALPHFSSTGNMIGEQSFPTSTLPFSANRYVVPSFQAPIYNQTSYSSSMQAGINNLNYTTHTAPLVGNSVPSNTALRDNGLANLTQPELNYLSEYMRMMGVTPPANQQQWSVLLSSYSSNNGFQGINAFPQSPVSNNYCPNGPDLSQLFPSSKTIESTIAPSNDSQQLISVMASSNKLQSHQPVKTLAERQDSVNSKTEESSELNSSDCSSSILLASSEEKMEQATENENYQQMNT